MNSGPTRHWVLATLLGQARSPRTWVWATLLAGLSLLLANRPLFDLLGFEWAFVMAAAGSIAAADGGSAFVATARKLAGATPATPLRLVGLTVAGASLHGLSLLVLPIAIICLNGLRIRNCDWAFGAQALLGLTVVSTLLAAGLGAVLRLAVRERRVLGNALPHLAIIASAALSLWHFYGAPAVFSYNPFVGYFPGNLYDEDIRLGMTFWWARAYHLAVLVLLMGLCAVFIDTAAPASLALRRPVGRWWRQRRTALALTLASALVGSLLWQRAASLGFHVSAADIAAELGGRYESEHFIIYYPRGGEIERDIELIARDHEFRLGQVSRALAVEPSGKISSFYFRDPAQKARLMGAKNVYMAKPWRKEIYLNHQPFPHEVLRHELVHVVAGEFGDKLFGVSARTVAGLPALFNVGLIEGIAVAVDWPDHFTRELTPHQSVKAMMELGFAPPVRELLSTGFLSFSSARSYTTAGSFVRYLLDRFGVEPLKRLYRSGGDFAAAYELPLTQLAADWQAFIEATELPKGAADQVRERFRRRSIFERPCPHAVARRRQLAREAAAFGEYRRASLLLREVCRDTPNEPRHLLDLAGVLPFAGDEHLPEAIEILKDLTDDSEQVSSSLRAEAHSMRAAIAARRGDWAAAEQALLAAAALPLDDDAARNLEARLIAVRHQGPAREALRAYFWPPNDLVDALAQLGRASTAAAAEPGLALAHYLVAWNLAGHTTPSETIAPLTRALDLGLPSPRFERAAARVLAVLGHRAGDDEATGRAIAILSRADQPEVVRLLAADWRERLTFR